MAERISLAEAYNNKDVITQIAILKDKLDSIPNADLTNVVLKTGDQIIDGEKTFNDPIVANGGVVFANSGIHVNGTLEVDGDIIQNGSAYETHAEQVFTKNDLIVTREDAIGGIAAGQLSGIRVKKYNGVDDSSLGVDATGTMRVGDIGYEQPLATREEVANMTSGALVKWDGVNERMIAPASNVGDDTHPVKIVNGEEIAVTDPLVKDVISSSTSLSLNTTTCAGGFAKYRRYGSIVMVNYEVSIESGITGTWTTYNISDTALPKPVDTTIAAFSIDSYTANSGYLILDSAQGILKLSVRANALNGAYIRGSFMYLTNE